MAKKVQQTIDKRAKKALKLIGEYYMIDGQHHKNWVVVRVAKLLCDDKKAYKAFVDSFDDDSLGADEVYNGWKNMVKNDCIPP